MTVRAARADREKTKKTSALHIPSFRCLPPKGELQRRKDEQKTVRAVRADKQKTKERQTNDEEMIKDKACKIVEKVEFVEGDYG